MWTRKSSTNCYETVNFHFCVGADGSQLEAIRPFLWTWTLSIQTLWYLLRSIVSLSTLSHCWNKHIVHWVIDREVFQHYVHHITATVHMSMYFWVLQVLGTMGLSNEDPVCLNSFPHDKILDMTKLKAFADNKLNIDKMTISLLNRVENTEWKGENAGYQHFLLFPQCFPWPSSLGSLKVGIVW